MKSALLFIALILPMLSTWAGLQPLVTINDPSGDDFGAGNLVYPQRADFQAGNLDLLQLKISRDGEGFWFDAIFRNPIRDPVNVPDSVGAESLANFARKGFYQFNLDVYVAVSYTHSDAADDLTRVGLGGGRIIKKKN